MNNTLTKEARKPGTPEFRLTGQIEPFDTFWEAPENVEKGYSSFLKFYKHNYLKYLPTDRKARILVISCGAGYFVNLLVKEGYQNVLGIDSDKAKVDLALQKGLNCRTDHAFSYLSQEAGHLDVIIAEQEVNHLTRTELAEFLEICHARLEKDGVLVVHSLNGANPITGAEALAQNFNHYHTLTEYSLRQVLEYHGFRNVRTFPLNLYVFFGNPLNYIAWLIHILNTLFFRFQFVLYGKKNKIFTKKLGAVATK